MRICSPIALALLFACTATAADKIHIQVPARLAGDAAISRQPLTLTPTAPLPRSYGTNVFSRQPVNAYTDTAGTATFSNILWGYYRLTIPGTPGETFNLVVGTNLTGLVNIVTLLTNTPTFPPNPATNYYTQAQVDALIATVDGGGGGTTYTNSTNTTLQSGVISGSSIGTNAAAGNITGAPWLTTVRSNNVETSTYDEMTNTFGWTPYYGLWPGYVTNANSIRFPNAISVGDNGFTALGEGGFRILGIGQFSGDASGLSNAVTFRAASKAISYQSISAATAVNRVNSALSTQDTPSSWTSPRAESSLRIRKRLCAQGTGSVSSRPNSGRSDMAMNNFGEKINFLWSIAELLRDRFKRGKYQDIILPFTVLRRIDCVLAPTKAKVLETHGKLKGKLENLEPQLRKASGFAFYNTSKYDFEKLLDDPPSLATNLRTYLNGFSDNMREVLDKFDFPNTIAKLDEYGLLFLTAGRAALIGCRR